MTRLGSREAGDLLAIIYIDDLVLDCTRSGDNDSANRATEVGKQVIAWDGGQFGPYSMQRRAAEKAIGWLDGLVRPRRYLGKQARGRKRPKVE